MWPYYGMIAVSYGLSLVLLKKQYEDNDLARKLSISAFFLIWIVLLSLRDVTCGIDLVRYELKFSESAHTAWSEIWKSGEDVGYYLFQKSVRTVTSDFGIFLSLVAVLSLGGIWFFYGRESECAPLTIALLVTVAPFTMYFSGLRQVLAMAFVIPAWYCAKHKKWVWFILTVLLTFLFHRSGAVIALLYPLYHLRLSRKWVYVLPPAFLLVLMFNKPIFRFLMLLVGEEEYPMSDTGAYAVLILLVLLSVYSFVIPDEDQMDADTRALRNILVLAAFLQCFAPVHTLAMRVNYYFLLFIPILIPKIARRAKPVWRFTAQVSMMVMVGFFTLLFFLQGHLGDDDLHIFPYVFRYA